MSPRNSVVSRNVPCASGRIVQFARRRWPPGREVDKVSINHHSTPAKSSSPASRLPPSAPDLSTLPRARLTLRPSTTRTECSMTRSHIDDLTRLIGQAAAGDLDGLAGLDSLEDDFDLDDEIDVRDLPFTTPARVELYERTSPLLESLIEIAAPQALRRPGVVVPAETLAVAHSVLADARALVTREPHTRCRELVLGEAPRWAGLLTMLRLAESELSRFRGRYHDYDLPGGWRI